MRDVRQGGMKQADMEGQARIGISDEQKSKPVEVQVLAPVVG